jgi:hypothetical protein
MQVEEGRTSNNEMTQGTVKFLDDFFGETENWIWGKDEETGTKEMSYLIRKWGREHERWDFEDVHDRTVKRRLIYYFDLRGMKVCYSAKLDGRKGGGYCGLAWKREVDNLSENQREALDNIPEM